MLEKLYTLKKQSSFGEEKFSPNEYIFRLEKEGYLNEERYARAYCRGKFRISRWGKKKIYMGLLAKNISRELIGIAMQEIDPSEYEEVCKNIVEGKGASTALSRGFEAELVSKFSKL